MKALRANQNYGIIQKAAQMTLALVTGLILVLATTSRATVSETDNPDVLYVAPGASCGGGGATPCYGSVQAAVDDAAPGDEVRVASGIFTDTHGRPRSDITTTGVVTQVVYISKTIIIRGGYTVTNWSEPNPAFYPTLLDAQGRGRVLYITGDISPTIEGLRVTGGDADGLGDMLAWGEGVGNGGGVYLDRSNATLSGNIISANAAQRGGGVYLVGSRNATLINNVVADNRAEVAGGGLYIESSESRLLHTTIARNLSGDGSGIYIGQISQTAVLPSIVALTNTILVSHSVGITVTAGSTVALEATLWGTAAWANVADYGGAGAIFTGTINLRSDPAFVNSIAGDYHIGASSAARDAGVDAGVVTDIDGQGRPINMAYDIGADEFWGPALRVSKWAYPDPVEAGARLTYNLSVVNTGGVDLHATITDTLPLHILTDENLVGTVVLPGGKLVWRPVITAPSGVWTERVVVTVGVQYEDETIKVGYAGPLTNVVQVTTLEGATGITTRTTTAVLEYGGPVFLPLVVRNHPRFENVLLNPGFEGIGVPLDNDAPNPGNWTQDTFSGEVYNEIFTPEGWVMWWEEGVYRRPEAKVIDRQPPYTYDPVRIYQGYYAAMFFTFYGRHNAGYYQWVTDLPSGAPVTFYAHAHAWSCYDDEHGRYSCGNPENQGFRVGIDPDGGTDPWSPNVIWSERVSSPDVFRMIGPVEARVGPDGSVTVFLRSDVQWWPYKHSDAYWDNAALIVPVP